MVKNKFRGPLRLKLKPIPSVGLLTLSTDEAALESWFTLHRERHQHEIEKLALLLDHYQIAKGPNQFEELSLALAREFVPGFQVAERTTKRGRLRKWDILTLYRLREDIDQICRLNQTTVLAACNELASRHDWKALLAGDSVEDPVGALRKAYYNFEREYKKLKSLSSASRNMLVSDAGHLAPKPKK